MIKSLFAVIIGGSVGCTLRWLLSTRFNSLFPNLPPGTLVVNLLAGLIIGTALAYFLRQPHLDPFWKLMITTGLCGGLVLSLHFLLKYSHYSRREIIYGL